MEETLPYEIYGSVDLIGSIRRAKSPISLAMKYADAIIPNKQTQEAHFPNAARLGHAALDLLIAFDTSIPEERRNKRTAWDAFTYPEKFKSALEVMADSDLPFLRNQGNAFLDVGADDREMRGIKSTLRTECSRTYDEPALMDTLCSDSLDFSKITDELVTVYVCMPSVLMDVHFRYIKLLMTYFIAEIERGGLRRFS
jgi:type IV secretory pathway TraG/TraD family ATPase VirD4